jgi:hypothetical protein
MHLLLLFRSTSGSDLSRFESHFVFLNKMRLTADIRRSTRTFGDDKRDDDFFQIDVRLLQNLSPSCYFLN